MEMQKKKLDEQTTRAVETMCLMGLNAEELASVFSGYLEAELIAIHKRVELEKQSLTAVDHSPISKNCS